ncbi:mechanosensitive ion channel domain-containing protein [Sphingomicrobium sp. XHP0239]|uniref:mechanosensitive ion channel domain-containing protein n=1 Tax=Sphingomicrobium maritimum TaxID=3133972 RepID=UPI0031CC7E76
MASIALLLILFGLRLVVGHTLKGRENLPGHVVRRWSANVRNFLFLVAVVGLMMIWAPQLRTFALSLTAVVVAIVIATKEIILCLSGSALRTFTRAYSVGDVVEIGQSKGEVIDINLLATRLREFEQADGSILATGRTIILPHSLLFASPARVVPELAKGTRHRFDMTFEPEIDIFSLQSKIEGAARASLDANRSRTDRQRGKTGADQSQIVFDYGTTDLGKYRITIELMDGSVDMRSAENAIACAIGSLVHSERPDLRRD